MKKIYISPVTTEVKVSVCHMVCASEGTLDKSQVIESASGFGSRDFGGAWDDEEDY